MTDFLSDMAWTGFELAGEALALPAATVEQVMAASQVTALPFAPLAVEGVASISGDVVPVLDPVALRQSERPVRSRTGAQFMIVRFAGQRFAVRIERMLFVAATLSPESDGTTQWNGTFVTCIDPASLGLSALEPKLPPRGVPGVIANSRDGQPSKDMTQAEDAVLAVEVAGQLYGLPSQSVVELLENAELTPLPLVPPALRGVMVLRGRPLLAFCLDRLLGGAGAVTPGGHVVLSVGRNRIVLVVDAIVGLRRQGSQAVRLDPEKLIDAEWLSLAAQMPGDIEQRAARDVSRQRFLCVTLGDRPYALALAAVERVLPARQSVMLPFGAPAGVDGAIEYGGRIVPVTEGWRWLSLDAAGPASAYVVLQLDGEQRVLAVNGVQRIITIARDDILLTANADPRIAGLGTANGRTLEILSTAALLARQEAA